MSNLTRLQAVSSSLDTAIDKANNLPEATGGGGVDLSELCEVQIMIDANGAEGIETIAEDLRIQYETVENDKRVSKVIYQSDIGWMNVGFGSLWMASIELNVIKGSAIDVEWGYRNGPDLASVSWPSAHDVPVDVISPHSGRVESGSLGAEGYYMRAIVNDSGAMISLILELKEPAPTGTLSVYSTTVTLSSNSTSISFTGLKGEPKAFSICPTAQISSTGSYRSITNVQHDGSTLRGTCSYSNTADTYVDGCRIAYTDGTFKVTSMSTSTMGYFRAVQYNLVYVV